MSSSNGLAHRTGGIEGAPAAAAARFDGARRSGRSRWAALLITLGVSLAYFPRLGDPRGQTRPEEQFNMAISAEMQRDAAWATPTLEGVPTFFKPPLLYWGERASFELFGPSVFAARFPAALASVALALVTGLLAAALGASGLLAALLCAGSLGMFMLGRLALTDAPLVLCLTCAFACLWRAHVDALARADARAGAAGARRWLWAAGACVGLAILAKGPVAAVIFAVGALAFALLRERPAPSTSAALGAASAQGERCRPDPLLRPADIAIAGALAVAVAAPWYALMLVRHGRVFFDFFFVGMNVDRFRTPWTLGSLGVLWGGFVGMLVPWMPLAAAAVIDAMVPARGGGAGQQRTRDARHLFALCWAGATMLVFSLPAQKFPHYGLPAVPPLAILVALLAREPSESRALRWGAWASAAVCGVSAAAAAVGARILPPVPAVALALLLAATAAAYGARRLQWAAGLGVAAVACALAWLVPSAGYSPWPATATAAVPEDARVDVLGPPGLAELASGGRRVHYLSREDLEQVLARGDYVLMNDREARGRTEEVVAAQPRLRTAIAPDEVMRALSEGSGASLYGRFVILHRPAAASPMPAAGAAVSH